MKPLGTVVTSLVSATTLPLLNYLKLAIVASPFIVYLVQEVRMKWEVDKAVAVETKKQQQIADGRVAEVNNAFLTNAFNTVVVVQEAEDNTSRTPIDKEEVKILCNKDTQCRDRKR